MKIITLHKPVSVDKLLNHLQQNLNRQFREQRQENIIFQIYKAGNGLEIAQTELYEGPLFQLDIRGSEIGITRNEHYVDDVNSLTIESILNSLFEDMTNDSRGVDLLLEG